MSPATEWTDDVVKVGIVTAPQEKAPSFSEVIVAAAAAAGLVPRYQSVENQEPRAVESEEASQRRAALVARLFDLAQDVDEFLTQRRALDRGELQRRLDEVVRNGIDTKKNIDVMPAKIYAAHMRVVEAENAYGAAVAEINRLKNIRVEWETKEQRASREQAVNSARELAEKLRAQLILDRADHEHVIQESNELEQRNHALHAEHLQIQHQLQEAEAE